MADLVIWRRRAVIRGDTQDSSLALTWGGCPGCPSLSLWCSAGPLRVGLEEGGAEDRNGLAWRSSRGVCVCGSQHSFPLNHRSLFFSPRWLSVSTRGCDLGSNLT